MSDFTFTTNVPQPTFGANGVVLPTEAEVLTGVQADVNSALGGNINPQLTTPQGQLSTTETATIGESQALFAWFCNQTDPAYNSGRMQDAVGRIYFMTRIAAAPTIQPCICAGLDGVTIQIGNLVQDPSTNLLWTAQESGTIQGGSVTIVFACIQTNPVALAPQTLEIFQGAFGWESATPTGDAILGNLVENPAQFEVRRRNSVASNSFGMPDSVKGSVLAVPNVLDAYVVDNIADGITTIGGVRLAAHSLYTCVLGGDENSIAMAIFQKKGGGCAYTGTTSVVVSDPNPRYTPPVPSYTVLFDYATPTAFAAVITLQNNGSVPANASQLITVPIINAFAGLDGGPRAQIGSLVLSSRYVAGILGLGAWVSLMNIQIGLSGAACVFTGYISSTILTVTAVASGTLAIGQLIQDAGLMKGGTLITGLGTGTGGLGTYVVSIAQTIASETMNATNLSNSVQMNIDQAPAISATNIALVLV